MMRTLLLPVAILGAFTLSAQSHEHGDRCTAHRISEQYLQQQGITDLASALPQVASQTERGGSQIIPVVFHVVWNTAAENIPASAINAVVNQMNQDYSASNSNLSGVRPTFQGSIANTGIQFCLAQLDPAGNPTEGITRTQTTQTWFNPDTQTDAMKSAPLGRSPWDPTRYLNIWVCDITSGASGGSITLGYAYLPVGGMVGSSIDGIVIDYQYGMALSSRTATHEVGHYLGLLHPWGNGGCGSDDGFADTPNTDTPTFSCSNTGLVKCGVLTQYENFMDYSNCSAMFTPQQSNYMNGVLNGVRSSLLTSNGCGQSPAGICIPSSANGTADGDFINGVTLGTINNVNSGGVGVPTYTNFSSQWSTSLQRGNTYTISIQGGTYSPNHYAAWIDYDQNNSLVLSEKLGEFTTSGSNQTQTITFTVPVTATLGNTRLRVRGVYHNTGEPVPTDPCFNYAYGETEDYGIVITAPPTGLCIPTSTNGTADGDFINSVVLGTINNVNSGGVGVPTYTNFSSQWSTSLERGATYSISIQGGTYAPDQYAAWIDYDQNNNLVLSEKLGEFSTTGINQTQIITFTVPVTATLGNTRLRVRGVYHLSGEPSPTDPCYNYAYGETEDYGIVITAPASGTCIPTSLNGTSDGDFINGVTLGNIVNTNSGAVDGPSYTNYMSTYSTSLVRGSTYTINIQGGAYSPDRYAAWIDYDQNGTLVLGEKLGEWTSSSAFETQGITFMVPVNATLGTARLRVRGVFILTGEPSPVDPCFSYVYGETEDYSVSITTSTGLEDGHTNTLSLYPNPTAESFTLTLPDATPATVELRDMLGRLVDTHLVQNDRPVIDVRGYAAGSYLVRVQQGDASYTLRVEVRSATF